MESLPRASGQVSPPVVAVGASAGGIEALQSLLPLLPADLPAALAIVLHRLPVEEDERLTRVLAIRASIAVRTAHDGMAIRPGCVYVCPAGVDLHAERGRFRLRASPRAARFRPSVDELFRSVAARYGPRCAGVILSGMLDDGAAGLAAIKARGGRTFVQHPSEARFGEMPRRAIEHVEADCIDTVAGLAAGITAFARNTRNGEDTAPAGARE